MRKHLPTTIATGIVLSLLSGFFLTGCGNSEDGPMLSDEEKIQKTHQGRADYEKAMGGGRPPAAGGAAPGASTAGK